MYVSFRVCSRGRITRLLKLLVTIIHECEFLVVAIALETCKDLCVAKQIVSFIDNNAVRDWLISAKATGDIANKLLDSVLQIENVVDLVCKGSVKEQHSR